MNHNDLKSYATQARREFIQAVTERAAVYGVSSAKVEPVTTEGDVAIIAGRAFPASVVSKRQRLIERVSLKGFNQAMEALAYTWFNRFAAIRFMELHGYLEHGYRVLSHPEGKPRPEILEHADHIQFPGLQKETVVDLALAGNKDAELYRLLLTAQCNALHTAMPFLFEWIGDETELVLPDNLLHSDSIIRKLVDQIDEEDWQQVEIIGWLYQFYISERKEEVIGKVVASVDIPAATQLFTPNWIVKYLVQNTLGRQWLATYPQSTLRQQMEYYVEPFEQIPQVQEQPKAITSTSLDPEELTLLDPACGSGHILVEAYDVFKAIYQERGYRAKEIPILILQKNLFGLEIDDRAGQLAAFALMMKARADDPHIFETEAKPSILAFEDSQGMDAADITNALNSPINKEEVPNEYLFEEIQEDKDGLFSKKRLAEKGHVSLADITSLLDLFEAAKTFGSLIQIPPELAAKLPDIEKRLSQVLKHGTLTHTSAHVIKPLLQQGLMLARRYDSVVANPPYLNQKGMIAALKEFGRTNFSMGKSDLYAMFIERACGLSREGGLVALMTPFTWMFIDTFSSLRKWIVSNKTLLALVQPEYHAFFESAYVPICAWVITNNPNGETVGVFVSLQDFYGEKLQAPKLREAVHDSTCPWRFEVSPKEFLKIDNCPIAYWITKPALDAFQVLPAVSTIAVTKKGMATGNNARFVRMWQEVDATCISFQCKTRNEAIQSKQKWFPYNDGGSFKRWYGNNESIVNWFNDGEEAKIHATERNNGGHWSRLLVNLEYFFRPGVTWTAISTGRFGARKYGDGFLFSSAGMCLFSNDPADDNVILAVLNSVVGGYLLRILSPTLNYGAGEIGRCPIAHPPQLDTVSSNVATLVALAKTGWDSFETSWDFQLVPVLQHKTTRIRESQELADAYYLDSRKRMRLIETENNRIFINAYGLQNELAPEVTDDQITLYRPNRGEDIKRLFSYAIGCMLGRFSLDRPGLIYAKSGNRGFDSPQYSTFRADADGIIPLLETDWGVKDDACHRIVEFVSVVWPKERLLENLNFIAESLTPIRNEEPRDTIRRYLATGFYKHHLSMYKRRPIYWLFSSGKQRAFQCLVYLHRYNEGTLARMRTEYVIPLQGQIAARFEQLERDAAKANSTSHRNKILKEQTGLKKQRTELQVFDEKLRHYADKRINLDLDDGVKVNYGKFGDLLAEVHAVTGGSDE